MTRFVGCLDIQSNPRGRIPAKDALDAACLPGAECYVWDTAGTARIGRRDGNESELFIGKNRSISSRYNSVQHLRPPKPTARGRPCSGEQRQLPTQTMTLRLLAQTPYRLHKMLLIHLATCTIALSGLYKSMHSSQKHTINLLMLTLLGENGLPIPLRVGHEQRHGVGDDFRALRLDAEILFQQFRWDETGGRPGLVVSNLNVWEC